MHQKPMKFDCDVVSFSRDFEQSKQGGYFDLSDWGVIKISGPDALSYLQRMSTAHLKELEIGKASPGAFLNGKGTLIAWGDFFRTDEFSYLFVISPGQLSPALQHLEMFHFQEKLELSDETKLWSLFGLWKSPLATEGIHWQDFKRKDLQFVLFPRSKAPETIKQWADNGLSELGMPLFHYFRVLQGIPWMGWEANPQELILEVGLDAVVARNKGCYPGQEVVERIFTYGQVNRKLLRVELEKNNQTNWPEIPLEIKLEKESVGHLLSIIPSPEQSQRAVGLALIRKAFWEEKRRFELGLGTSLFLSPSESNS